MDLLLDDWQRFNELMNIDATDTFFQDTITWRRYQYGVDPWNENNNKSTFKGIELKCLINYNYFRTWGTTMETQTGENDRQTMVAIFNIAYLMNLGGGICTGNGNLNYDAGIDRFIHKGIVYKAMGDTDIAQSNKAGPLFTMIVLKKEEFGTTDTRDNVIQPET